MPPKQATLGYVKSSQTTIGWVKVFCSSVLDIAYSLSFLVSSPGIRICKYANLSLSKFFGKPNGSKPTPTQQTKLSFATKSAKKPKDEPQDSTEEAESSGKKIKAEGDAKENGDRSPGTTSYIHSIYIRRFN